jgi:hypothetical protein
MRTSVVFIVALAAACGSSETTPAIGTPSGGGAGGVAGQGGAGGITGQGGAGGITGQGGAVGGATGSDGSTGGSGGSGVVDGGWSGGAGGTDGATPDRPLPNTDAPVETGTDADPNVALVLAADTVLVPPVNAGAILGTITGYEVSSRCPMPQAAFCEAPMYSKYDRNTPEWWDILVDEHLLSRVNVVMAHGRGCFDPATGLDGNGNMCPRHLSKLVDAIDRAGAGDVYRLGMWDDTGAYPGARAKVDGLPSGTLFDLADETSWRFFWDYNMKIWFDTIPSRLWYRVGGRPVVAFWSLANAFFANQQGNASLLLRDLRAKFQQRYGENPMFIVDQEWPKRDTTITADDAQGMNAWFGPPGNWYTFRDWGGQSWGAMVPGFRDPQTLPGCGTPCREVPRRDGQALRDAMIAGANARFSLLEGWTDIYESAGYYRSTTWRFPNQYINVVREFADPTPPTLRFQAEAADLLSTRANDSDTARVYRVDVPNVGKLADATGWYVDFTKAAGWVEFSEVMLGCGTYRFTARLAAASAQKAHLEIDGVSIGQVDVAPTGGAATYGLAHLGSATVAAGKHRLRLVADSGGTNLDWFFLRRATGC